MNDLLQTLSDICDCLSDDLSTITSCEAFILAADGLAANGVTGWRESHDYVAAKEAVDG